MENPYEAPRNLDQAAQPGQLRTRSGGLVAICVIAIVLGSLGLMTGLLRVAALVGARQFNEAIFKHMQTPQAKIQEEMAEKMYAVADRWRLVMYPLSFAHLGIAGSLLAGGIMALRSNPRGPEFLRTAVLAAIAFELIKVVPEGMLQHQNQMISREYMGRLISAQSGQAGAAAFSNSVASVTMILSFVILVGWGIAKIIYYVVAAHQLRKLQLAAPIATQSP